MKQLVIDLLKWARGGHPGTYLLGQDGRRCCLGFLGQACSIQDHEMLSRPNPDMCVKDNPDLAKLWPEEVVNDEVSDWTVKAIRINDDRHIDELERCDLLTKHFKLIGIDLEFR